MGQVGLPQKIDRGDVDAVRAHALTAAKELYYGDEVRDRLLNAKTAGEISRIMATARKELL